MSKKKVFLSTLAAISLLQTAQPALASKEDIGTIIGGIIGGVIGNATGDSHVSRRNGTILGVLIGGFLGNRIGNQMDERDKRAYAEAQRRALDTQIGETVEWEGSDYGSRTGARGSVTTTEEGYHRKTGEYCRAYASRFVVKGQVDNTKAAACLDNRGNWRDVKDHEVDWSTGGDAGSLPGADNQFEEQNYTEISGGTLVAGITRKTGGEWIRIKLQQPSILARLHVQVQHHGVKVHQMKVYTRNGHEVPFHFDGTNTVFNNGDVKALEMTKVGVSTGAIDVRVESFGGYGSLIVVLEDIHGDRVPVRIERFSK